MSKFKVGDRVRVINSDYAADNLNVGSEHTVQSLRDYPAGVFLKGEWEGEHPHDLFFHNKEVELVEHPALTLAKAEVVRIRAQNGISWSEGVRLNAFAEVLAAFGLEYRAKPVVPQPVEYEFVPVDDTRGSAPQESVR